MGLYDEIKNTNLIKIPQGSDYSDTITVFQAGGLTPVDLTGYTVKSQLKSLAGELVAEFVCSVPTPANGIVMRSLPNSVTTIIVPVTTPKYVWGLQLTSPSLTILPEIQGGATVTAEVVK